MMLPEIGYYLFVFIYFLLILAARSYPQNGFHLRNMEDLDIPPNKWKLLSGWIAPTPRQREFFKKAFFIENFEIVDETYFHPKQSGIYYISIQLNIESETIGNLFINISSKTDKIYSKNSYTSETLGAQFQDTVMVNKDDRITIWVVTSTPLILKSESTVCIQHVSSYEKFIGFIAQPMQLKTINSVSNRHIVGWATKFSITNGFSKSLGSYVSIISGMYLIICKLILIDIFGTVSISIYKNQNELNSIKRYYPNKVNYDTITISHFESIQVASKISVFIKTTSGGSYISNDSTYSVSYISNLQDSKSNSTYIWDKSINFTRNDQHYKLIHWEHSNDTQFFNGGFHIMTTGYYLLLTDIRYSYHSLKKPKVIGSLFIDNHLRVNLLTSNDDIYPRSYGSHVFFLKEKESVYLELKTDITVLVLKESSFLIYQIPFYKTSLFLLSSNIDSIIPTEELQNKQDFLFNIKSVKIDQFYVKHHNNEKLYLEIMETGIYYIVLTSSFEWSDEIQLFSLSLLHRHQLNDRWLVISKCYAVAFENCFIPLILKLRKGDQLSIASNYIDQDEMISGEKGSYLEIRHLQKLNNVAGFSQSLEEKVYTNKKSVTIENISNQDERLSFMEKILYSTDELEIPVNGVYIVVCNIVLKFDPKYEDFIFSLDIRKKRRSLFRSIDKVNSHQNSTNIALIGSSWLDKGEKIEISISHDFDKPLKWSISNESRISFFLLTKRGTELLVVEHVYFGSVSSSKGALWQSQPKFLKQQTNKQPYFDYFYEIKAERTFAAILSVTIIGKPLKIGENPYIEASIHLKEDTVWPQLFTSRSNFKLNDMFVLQMTGIVILHPTEIIKVFLNISEDLEFEAQQGTLLTLVILDGDEEYKTKEDFMMKSITFNGDNTLKEQKGVYAVLVDVLKKDSSRQRKDVGIISNDTSVENKLKDEVDKIWSEKDKTLRSTSTTNNLFNFLRTGVQEPLFTINLDEKSIKMQTILYLSKNTQLTVQSKEEFILRKRYLLLGTNAENLKSMPLQNDVTICSQLIGYQDLSPWFQKDRTVQNNWFYRSSSYKFIYLSANILVQESHENSSMVLFSNNFIENGMILKRNKLSSTGFMFSLQVKLYIKKNDVLQLKYTCGNSTEKLLKSSRIDVYEEESIVSIIDENLPSFYENPSPKFVTKSYNLNYTCKVFEEKSMNYVWNRIDLFNGQMISNVAHGNMLAVTGQPEESGYYYCSVNYNGIQIESDMSMLNISDDNECEMMHEINSTIKLCHGDANCTNLVGSFYCKCYDGFRGDGYSCEDINECFIPDICGNYSVCQNFEGGYNCSCDDGFRGIDGKHCEDINECKENGNEFCEKELTLKNSTCVNYIGGFNCQCDNGFEKKSGKCIDVNECDSDLDEYPCDTHATCANTEGSFNCKCDDGWRGNGTFCEDVDECEEGLISCTGNATCNNLPGSFRCKCNRGYKGDGVESCVPLGCLPPKFCNGQYLVTWWARTPYIETLKSNGKSNVKGQAVGLFRDILTQIVIDICRNCSELLFTTPLNVSTQVELMVEDNKTDFACPLYGSKDQERFRGYPFVPIVESPGVAFFVKEQKRKDNPLLQSLAGSWPILVVTLLLASLSGVIIWFLDTVHNPKEFPHSFLEGSWEGFWWAFITMTTVGYGDKAPRSFLARAFGIVWILVGLVIISTFTATITTVLTATSLANEAKLYGTKVGALANSEEFRLGVKRNADVKGYSSVPAILDALRNGDIQGALLDTYIAGEFQNELQGYKLQEILEHVFVYGVVLSRDAESLEQHFRTYIERKQGSIYNTISKVVKPLKENKASVASAGKSASLFDAESPFFWQIMITGGIVLVCLLFIGFLWDFLYWRRLSKKREKQKTKNLLTNGHGPKRVKKLLTTYDVVEYQRQAFKKEIFEIKTEITRFSDVWVTRLTEIEVTHELQLDRVQKWLGQNKLDSTTHTFATQPHQNGFVTFGKLDEQANEITC